MEQSVPEQAPESCPGVQNPKAGKSKACDGCPNQKNCSSGKTQEELEKAIEELNVRFESVKKILIVCSGKGGVGKSTVATQLARGYLHVYGYEVGLLDIDICGPSIPCMSGFRGQVHTTATGYCPVISEEGMYIMSSGYMLKSEHDAVIWRGPKKDKLIKQFLFEVDWGELDILVIDCPPGTSDEIITLSYYLKHLPIVEALLVTTPQETSVKGVRRNIDFFRRVGIPIVGVAENMSFFNCQNCHQDFDLFYRYNESSSNEISGIKVLEKIPMDPYITNCADRGICIFNDPDNLQQNTHVHKAYLSLMKCLDPQKMNNDREERKKIDNTSN